MTEEHKIQTRIMAAVSHECAIFRTNSGDFWQGELVWSREFQQNVLINLRRVAGLPTGHADLSGVRKSDGKAVFIEVKTKTGRASDAQKHFLAQMAKYGAISGVCRSPEDALKLIKGEIL